MSNVLSFFFQGLVIVKIDRLKTCYAYDMSDNEFQPNEIEVGLKKVLHIVFDPFLQLKHSRNLISSY